MAVDQNGSTRATKQTAAGGGASRPSSAAATSGHDINVGGTQFTKAAPTKTTTMAASGAGHDMNVGGTQFAGITLSSLASAVIYNDNPDGGQAPYVVPGMRATREMNTYLNSTITALAQPDKALRRKTNWGFRFHYNPETISESVQTNYTLTPDAADVGNVLGTGLGAMSFKFLINRMEDAARHRTLVYPMLGKKTFYDLGTLYDLEFLYRTINGDPQSTSIMKDPTGGKADPNGSANLGFLYMTAVEIRFNNLRFRGFITSIDIEHQMFTDKMVPILTYVTISATRYLSGSALPGANEASTSAAPATPPKPQAKANTPTKTPEPSTSKPKSAPATTPRPQPGPAPTPRT